VEEQEVEVVLAQAAVVELHCLLLMNSLQQKAREEEVAGEAEVPQSLDPSPSHHLDLQCPKEECEVLQNQTKNH
jgi:hypothetical protein